MRRMKPHTGILVKNMKSKPDPDKMVNQRVIFSDFYPPVDLSVTQRRAYAELFEYILVLRGATCSVEAHLASYQAADRYFGGEDEI